MRKVILVVFNSQNNLLDLLENISEENLIKVNDSINQTFLRIKNYLFSDKEIQIVAPSKIKSDNNV